MAINFSQGGPSHASPVLDPKRVESLDGGPSRAAPRNGRSMLARDPFVSEWRSSATAVLGSARVGEGLTPEGLRRVAEELVPLVCHDTGLSLSLERMNFRVITAQTAAAEHLRTMPPAMAERARAALEKSLLAWVDPRPRSLTVVKDAFAEHTWDALREIVYHELIHVAQAQSYPSFSARLELASMATTFAAPEQRAAINSEIERLMSAMEGQAIFHQLTGRSQRFPHSTDPLFAPDVLAAQLCSPFGRGLWYRRYVAGLTDYARVIAHDASDAHRLFDDEEFSRRELRSASTVTVPGGHDMLTDPARLSRESSALKRALGAALGPFADRNLR